MKFSFPRILTARRLAGLLISIAILLYLAALPGYAQGAGSDTMWRVNGPTITGILVDPQEQPVQGAFVRVLAGEQKEPIAETETQANGSFTAVVPADVLESALTVVIERPHFRSVRYALSESDLAILRTDSVFALPMGEMERRITWGFWIATLAFVGMLALVALEVFHNTLAVLAGVGMLFISSYLGAAIYPDLFVFDFERSLIYIDWNVIFLVMGMMIVIAVVEGSGVFQWLAYFAFHISRGRPWLLVIVLMIITAIASAFLDNVTTMLLMTPITIQIALALQMSPLPLLMPEVMASNVGGIATLIGTPTNILIGSYAAIPFASFLRDLTPGVLMAMVALAIYVQIIYRQSYRHATAVSPELEARLRENSRITQPEELKKAGWVGLGMLILFLLGERVHLVPAVTALLGATALLLWIRPDVEEMIEAVDWTTLVFLMSLFIVVGGIQEVGLIGYVAQGIGRIVGTNLTLAMIMITWLGALMSMVVANIPFTAAMLPVVGFLSSRIPGAQGHMLFFALSVGSAMGGNGSLIGASANMVTAGIAERVGYPMTYMDFLKQGFPAMIVTVAVGTLWLLFHF
jgi:Na+/H+ antiporter NhaD/arsenite permease-like protein